MKILSYLKGLIVAGVTLLMDAVVLPVLEKAISILDFLPDVIEVVWTRLKDWSLGHK